MVGEVGVVGNGAVIDEEGRQGPGILPGLDIEEIISNDQSSREFRAQATGQVDNGRRIGLHGSIFTRIDVLDSEAKSVAHEFPRGAAIPSENGDGYGTFLEFIEQLTCVGLEDASCGGIELVPEEDFLGGTACIGGHSDNGFPDRSLLEPDLTANEIEIEDRLGEGPVEIENDCIYFSHRRKIRICRVDVKCRL